VRGDRGLTVIAGYPWFGDWGRDTFIALRGLCLATGRITDAGAILEAWAGAVSGGMLPNLFPDGGATPEYNSVDAALWFVVAAYEHLSVAAGWIEQRRKLVAAVEAILEGYASGTRFGIGAAADGLLAAGELGTRGGRAQARPTQLTWMDAAFGERVFTPRVGKPVEVQALWLNALRIGALLGCPSAWRWAQLERLARRSFDDRFWNATAGHLHDVVDLDHHPGAVDPTLRPNQILCAGGLPFRALDGERAASVVDAVERALWTPLGLRTLPPGHPDYRPRYEGGPAERDAAYHQGTAWPWLLDAFVEAWLHARGHTPAAQAEARARFLAPLRAHLADAGLGHVSEIADAEAPHAPRGCPFQAWSLAALLRLERRLAAPA
jgi:predicted glycogen debranching enzyme